MSVPGAVPASMAKRLLAWVIDAVAALLLGGGFVMAGVLSAVRLGEDLVQPTTVLGALALAASGLVQWGLLALRGYTLGRALVGLRVLSAATGRPLGWGRSLLRLAVPALAGVVPLVGPLVVHLSPLLDPSGRRQGWHDRAARDMVFDVSVGRDPSVATTPAASAAGAARRFDALLDESRPARGLPRQGGSDRPVAPDLRLPPNLPVIDEVPGVVPQRPGDREPWAPPAAATSPAPAATSPAPASAVPPARPSARPAESRTPLEEPVTVVGLPSPATARSTGTHAAPGLGAEEDTDDQRGALPGGRILPTAPMDRPAAQPALDEEVERTRLRSARSKVAYAPSRQGHPRATLLLWDNRVVVIEGTALVGRNPAPRVGEALPVQVIAVVDRGRSVSKTHLALGVDEDGVWLRDRSSTNGTVVTLDDGQQILCAPEQTVRVPVGASVAFGDYWLTVAE